MKKFLMTLFFLTCLSGLHAETSVLAFPGAEGYGRYATGGRGGKIYTVTSLEDCAETNLKEGTFRWAVKQPGKKIVVFKVSGTIYLTSALRMDCGDLTILGQTAPGDGICLADYPVTISCENAIIRYIRFRLGNRQVANHEGDGFGFEGANNVIMDHCSVSWSIDECLSISAATNLTIQWCIVSQALNNAGHAKGAHGYGGNWGGTCVSFHHNLIAQCTSRVPRLGGDTDPLTNDWCDLRNNVFYNWGGEGCYGAEAIDVNFVNNYYKPGPCTDKRGVNIRKRICAIGIRTNSYIKTYPAFAHDLHKWGHFYVEGNVNPDYADVTRDNWTYGIVNQVTASSQDGTWTATTRDTIHLREPHEFVHVTTHSAEVAYEKVLALAGASYKRDVLDQLIVSQVTDRLGEEKSGSNGALYGQIDCQTDNVDNGWLLADEVENGAWPKLNTNVSAQRGDADGDGIPDNVEEFTFDLDPGDRQDAAAMYGNTGYTYVEYYVNQTNKTLREWNAQCLEDGEVQGVGMPSAWGYVRPDGTQEISALTFKGYDSSKRQQLFANGLSIANASGGISGATGNDKTLKLRAQQYTINVPAGINATALRIVGYPNYGYSRSGKDIWISECGGTTFTSSDYVLTAEDGVVSDITIPLTNAVSGGPLTVTFKDNSPTVKFFIVDSNLTGISSVISDDRNGAFQTDNTIYYNVLGQRVSNPDKGLYIIGGKKVLKQ